MLAAPKYFIFDFRQVEMIITHFTRDEMKRNFQTG